MVGVLGMGGTILAQANRIVGTPHNLSVSGTGSIKAVDEQEICVFCHLPHNSIISAPLWSHTVPTGPFDIYSSSTLSSNPESPGGTSRLCLSCHDGTVAVGDIVGKNIATVGTDAGGVMPPGPSTLSSDLSDDHPVSMLLDPTVPEIITPTPPVRLDASGQVQCSSCHDAHNNENGNFLLMADKNSLCTNCHQKSNWLNSAHAQSATLTDGCLSCHDEHTAAEPVRLLQGSEENLCFNCHQGVTATDIKSILETKTYVHPVIQVSGIHDPIETPYEVRQTPPWLPETSTSAIRHSECVDCHNPHAGSSSQPFAGVWGIDLQGHRVDQVSYEYEVCFKCHGDSQNKPAGSENLKVKFHISNPSYHPVEAAGVNQNVPSLLSPYDVSSIITCSDCHGAENAGEPAGPHGSNYPYILKYNYNQQDNTSESYFQYELCYTCHDRSSVLGNQSFKDHRKHIVNERTPCWVCHAAHGSTTNTHLIDFDTTVVQPSMMSGRLEFIDDGVFKGQCYLRCHGKNHNPKRY